MYFCILSGQIGPNRYIPYCVIDHANARSLLKKIYACILLYTCTFIFSTLHEDSLSLPCTSDRH